MIDSDSTEHLYDPKRVGNEKANLDLPRNIVVLVWDDDGVFLSFKHPLQQELGRSAVVVMPILMVQPLFGLWMLYQAIRHEAKPLWYVLLAASVPFACVWYYVERYRPRKLGA